MFRCWLLSVVLQMRYPPLRMSVGPGSGTFLINWLQTPGLSAKLSRVMMFSFTRHLLMNFIRAQYCMPVGEK